LNEVPLRLDLTKMLIQDHLFSKKKERKKEGERNPSELGKMSP